MKRSKFSLSNSKLLTLDGGALVPICLTEVLPGDTIQQASNMVIRTSPLLAPIYHRVNAYVWHYFVPHRLVWDKFEDFITGGPDGNDTTIPPTVAMAASGGALEGSLADYYGVPTGVDGLQCSALPFRGYAAIFNEFIRDQDLVSEIAVSKADGPDAITNMTLQNAMWEKDYFTSARPWEQKGPQITVPIGDSAPIERVPNASSWGAFNSGTETANTSAQNIQLGATGLQQGGGGSTFLSLDPRNQLIANLAAATGVSVTQFRQAMALQRFQEDRARFGSRYTEYLRSIGVRSSDARLQRPEFLGGGRQTIQFSEVLTTAASGTGGTLDDPVGTMRGHGIAGMRSNRFRRFFEEHGYVHTLLCIRPKTMYSQGLPRHWSRKVKEDYFQHQLQHIGQQAVLNKEVFAAHSQPEGTFGYQDRYDEYRRAENTVSAEFRSILDFWHMARDFGTEPALNGTFVTANPTKRVFAEQNQHSFWVYSNHSIQARRQIARTGTSFIK